jgi:hypothetical protein
LRDFFSDRSNRFELPHLTRLTHCAIIIRCSRRRVAASVEMQTSPFLASHKIVAGCTSTRNTSNRSHTHTHTSTRIHRCFTAMQRHSMTHPCLARCTLHNLISLARDRLRTNCPANNIVYLHCLASLGRHLAVLISAQMTPYPRLPNNTGMQAQVLRKSRIERLSSMLTTTYPTVPS